MRILLLLTSLSLLLAACGGGSASAPPSTSTTGQLSLIATDKPLDHALVEDARIWVDQIRIHHESDGSSGFYELYAGTPIELDLDGLINGITQGLVDADLPAGSYKQLRLHLSSARLELTNGNVYQTQDDSLKLTSQDTSGYKVMFDPAIEVIGGLKREVLLDFDLSKTFKPVPASDPLTATSYHLHPVIKVAVLSESGEVRGVVTEDDGTGALVGVVGASLYLLPPGETDLNEAITSTATGAAGSYALLGVAPGTYDVAAVVGPKTARLDGVVVAAGSYSTADLTVQ